MKIAIAIIIAVLVIGGGYLLFFAKKTGTPVTSTSAATAAAPITADVSSTTVTTTTTTAATPKTVTVTYTGSSFSPATVTIHQGDSVHFVDGVSDQMWIASNPHPTHQGYSGTTVDQHCPDTTGTAFDQCSFGSSYTFVFQKIGTWGYHNHANHGVTGTIVVTQ